MPPKLSIDKVNPGSLKSVCNTDSDALRMRSNKTAIVEVVLLHLFGSYRFVAGCAEHTTPHLGRERKGEWKKWKLNWLRTGKRRQAGKEGEEEEKRVLWKWSFVWFLLFKKKGTSLSSVMLVVRAAAAAAEYSVLVAT